MNADDLIELAEDPRFIEGIYNYCDRWCERCPFTSRCLNYAQLQLMEDERGFNPKRRDTDNARFWHSLHNSFQLTQDLLQRMAAERGIDLNAPEFQAAMDEAGKEQRRRDRAARAHPLTQAAEEYGFEVEHWFNRNSAALQERLRRARAGDEIRAGEWQPEDVEGAIAVIRWYQFLPATKLVGVLSAEKDERIRDAQAEHDNGRVKVILIGIDRSLLAWGRIQLFWPTAAREIMRFASLLAELRLWLERAFPEAREFIRPGFDEASTLVM